MKLLTFFALTTVIATASAQWDFEYSYPSVTDSQVGTYVAGMTNMQAVNDGRNQYFIPIANGTEAQITYHFPVSGTIADAYVFSHIATYDFGGGRFGFGSLWGSTNGLNWQLLMDAPTPSGRIDMGYFYDQHLPASLLGDDEIWIQTRLQTSGLNIMAQFSRTDNTVPIQIFQFKADVVPEPTSGALLLCAGALCLRRQCRSLKS